MKFTLCLISAFFSLSTAAFADSAATLTCTGKSIVLEEVSPYLGENSIYTQRLFILKAKDFGTLNYYSAFFLDVKETSAPAKSVVIVGNNKTGGYFTLRTNPPKQVEDSPVIHEISKGHLSYFHGPLKGTEAVTCEKQ